MNITTGNYNKIIKQVGLSNLPEELQQAFQYMKESTKNFKNWSIDDPQFIEVQKLSFEKLEEYIEAEGLDGKEEPYSAHNEIKMFEEFLTFNNRIVTKIELKQFIDHLQRSIRLKLIRKVSPYVSEVLKMQSFVVTLYNKPSKASKLKIPKSLIAELEAAIVDYFNRQKDQPSDKINPTPLTGIENATESDSVTSTALTEMVFPSIGFTGKWLALMGDPHPGFTAMIYGKPKMGKSSLAIDFAGYLAKTFGKVLYVAKEEGIGMTLKMKIDQKKATHPNLFVSGTLPEDLADYQFIFLDSINSLGLKPSDLLTLKEMNPGKSFIYIFQTTKAGLFRGANTFQHDVDIVIEVLSKGKAVQFGRFNQGGELNIFENDISSKLTGLNGNPSRKNKKSKSENESPKRFSLDEQLHSKLSKNTAYQNLLSISSEKPNDWDEIRPFDINAKQFLDRLPMVKSTDYSELSKPNDSFPSALQGKMFILNREGVYYFIDTQGYFYARCALKLENYSPL